MAKVAQLVDGLKLTCDAPKCLDGRLARGQAHGRFLGCVEWVDDAVVLTYKCPECGQNHTVNLSIPPQVRGTTRAPVESKMSEAKAAFLRPPAHSPSPP
jgi:hypothetical protein